MKNILLLLCISSIGCAVEYDYDVLRLRHPNPTSYVFPIGKRDMVEAIDKVLKPGHHEDANTPISGGCIWYCANAVPSFLQGRCANIDVGPEDILGFNWGPSSSQIYFRTEEPIWYYVDHIVRLTELSPDSTRVDVSSFNGSILAGYYSFFGLPPHTGMAINRSVPPSTIEEYLVLLDIGEALGIKGQMPPLILPDFPDGSAGPGLGGPRFEDYLKKRK